MGRIAKWLAAAALLLAGLPGQAQEKTPFSTEGWWKPAEPPFSPAVHDDASITFRLRAPRAHEVTLLLGEWEVSEIPMQRIACPADILYGNGIIQSQFFFGPRSFFGRHFFHAVSVI